MGRARDCDFQLKDQRASGRHAQIVREGSRYYLEDLGSTNGTLLNKRPVQRAPLAAGSVIQIGNSGFRVRLPADARGAAAAPAGDGEFVEFDVEKFLAADRTQHPLAVGALLLILAAVGYFSIDIALRLSRKRDADPPPEASLITGNWSFEETKPGGTATEAASAAVPGWRVAGGDQGSIASVEAHAQVPGRRALRLEANGDPDLCRAVHATDLVLGGDRLFRLEGFVHNEGAFAAGFLVEWLGAAKDVPVERALTETARERGEEIDVNQVFAAPPSASQARISCFVLGERGAAVFDRIAFVPAPGSTPGPVAAVRPGPGGEARTAGAAGGEAEADAEGDGGEGADRVPGSGRRAFRCGEEGELKVELESDGTFALHRPRRQLIPALWAGSPPDRDPLGFGPRLALARIGSEDEGSALLTGEVPDVKESSWLPLETTVRRSGKDVAIRWRTGVTAPGATPPALAAYLHTREPWSPVAAVVSGGEAATGNGTVEAGKDGAPATLVKEVVIGQGEERVSLVFPSPVVVSTVPHPFDASRTLLVLASDGPEVEVVVSEGSREESFLARGLLQSAEEAYRNGQAGAAVKLIAQLRERYPQDKAAIERAAELLAAWKRLAAEEVAALEREGAVLKETSSPVVKDLILRRAAALRERLAGAPEAEEAARVAAEVEAQWSQRLRTRKEAELRSWLEQAQKHLSAEDLGLAEVYFRCVAEGDPEGELGRTARARLKTIEGRLTTRVNILLQ
jgi:hypothetical protein